MKRTIDKGPLIERVSDERHVFEVINQLQKVAALEVRERLRGATKGDGAYLDLWTDSLNAGEAFCINATVIGICSTGANWFQVQGGYRNSAGSLVIIGGSLAVTKRQDEGATDATLRVSGTQLSLSVKDDGVSAMNWTAYLVVQAAA